MGGDLSNKTMGYWNKPKKRKLIRRNKLILVALFFCMFFVLTGCSNISRGSSRIYEMEYNIVFNKAVSAVIEQNWQIIFTDKNSGVISAKTHLNIFTLGDTISIQVNILKSNTVRVDVSSDASQLFDWGHNSRNVSNYLKTLELLLSKLADE